MPNLFSALEVIGGADSATSITVADSSPAGMTEIIVVVAIVAVVEILIRRRREKK